ncbi:hypothetical protein BS47DRAFT_1398731 [Hydnum rufescens UP504]|uniref:Uncharacterized protein n=1 Tax=Hydnum rufescens UP504 TaxID=1448309 RepID=A0A9P6AM39_9AGAM|nr:hypothetical protein BS47DRAFT_1398731 [Hydnum rufescens UP504]
MRSVWAHQPSDDNPSEAGRLATGDGSHDGARCDQDLLHPNSPSRHMPRSFVPSLPSHPTPKSSSPVKSAVRFTSSMPLPLPSAMMETDTNMSKVLMALEQLRLELTSVWLELSTLRHEVSGVHRDISVLWSDVGEIHDILSGSYDE